MKRPMLWVAGLLLVFFLGIRFISGESLEHSYYTMDESLQGNLPAKVQGTLEHIEKKPNSYFFYLKEVSVTLHNKTKIYYFSDFLAILPQRGKDSCQPGNILQISGSIQAFSTPSNPGQFDEKSYYREKNIYYKIIGREYLILDSKSNPFLTALYQGKKTLKQIYEKCLPDREAGAVAAMLLGDKSALDMELKELYQINGIGHLLAISGLHISILCMALYRGMKILFGKMSCVFTECLLEGTLLLPTKLYKVFSFFLDRFPFAITIVSLYAYGKLTGFGISTSRAVVMMLLFLLAGEWKKSYDAITAMGISAIIIWLQKPYAIFSCSFLLSFSAMAGIYLVLPAMKALLLGTGEKERAKLRRRKRKERELTANSPWKAVLPIFFQVREKLISNLLSSLSIWLSTLPILCYFFYEYPTYGILLNLFVLPLASVLVIAGMAGGILGAVFLPLGKCILLLVHGILVFYENICRCFQKLPCPIQITGRPRIEHIYFYYLILILFCIYISWSRSSAGSEKERCRYPDRNSKTTNPIGCRLSWKNFMPIFLSCSLIFSTVLLSLPDKPQGFSCTFLDVGQGDGIVLRTSTGITILVDGGSTDVSQVGKYRILPFLKYYGIKHIDYMIMSHEDEDHISGQKELLKTGKAEGISIGCLLLPEPAASSLGKNYKAMEELAGERGIPCQKLHKGDRLHLGMLQITCLHPDRGFEAESANAYSAVLDIRYGSSSLLLTGDLEKNGEKAVMESLEHYDIIKTAHHGSKNSTPEAYLAKARPAVAVISCGKNNRYGHPHRELLKRLHRYTDNVCRTDCQGAIFLQTEGEHWRIRAYRSIHSQ